MFSASVNTYQLSKLMVRYLIAKVLGYSLVQGQEETGLMVNKDGHEISLVKMDGVHYFDPYLNMGYLKNYLDGFSLCSVERKRFSAKQYQWIVTLEDFGRTVRKQSSNKEHATLMAIIEFEYGKEPIQIPLAVIKLDKDNQNG